MFNPSYLTLSDYHVYHLRWPIPSALTCGKKRYVKFSLETRDPKEALLLAKVMSYHAETQLQQGKMQGMDYIEIREMLHSHFRAMRELRKQSIQTHGRLTLPDISALQKRQEQARAAIQSGDYSAIGTDAELDELIVKDELPIEKGSALYETFRKEFLAAMRDYCGSVLEYDSRFENYNFRTDPVSLAMREVMQKNKRKKLVSTIEAYISDKLRLGEWREHVAYEYRSQFNLLTKYLGEDAPLHISAELAADIKDMLVRLPKHSNKKPEYKDLTIPQLVALNVPKKQCLGPVTVSKLMRTYSTFYDWAVKRKDTDENNFKNLVDNAKKVALKRKPFAKEEAERILQFVLTNAKPHHKWGTLIAFYTGARLNEIAQLHTNDIIEQDGLPCFCFTDESGEDEVGLKRLKNESSKRIVPIHSKLIELGFLKYHAQVGKSRLFPDFTYNEKDGYGRNLGRWFNESLLRKNLKIDSPALVFHSIRHTVAQQLRNNKISEATIKEIIGHSQDGVLLNVYATQLDLKVMQDALETLVY